jgi:hypothetical protein
MPAPLPQLPVQRQAIKMGATDHQRHAIVTAGGGRQDAASRSRRPAVVAVRAGSVGHTEKVLVGENPAKQGDAGGQSVARKPTGTFTAA